MDPTVLAKTHSGVAILIFIFYIIRGGLMLASSAKLRSVVLTAFSHFLLVILIFMGLCTTQLKGISFTDGFVLTKLTCLILFVLLGGMSLKQGLSKVIAIILWLLGLAALTYAWMLGNQLVPTVL